MLGSQKNHLRERVLLSSHNKCFDCMKWQYTMFYQLPLILTALLHFADKRYLPHGMCLYQVMMTLHDLNDLANDAEPTQKNDHCVIFASLKSE